jgi:hypothetical protein
VHFWQRSPASCLLPDLRRPRQHSGPVTNSKRSRPPSLGCSPRRRIRHNIWRIFSCCIARFGAGCNRALLDLGILAGFYLWGNSCRVSCNDFNWITWDFVQGNAVNPLPHRLPCPFGKFSARTLNRAPVDPSRSEDGCHANNGLSQGGGDGFNQMKGNKR